MTSTRTEAVASRRAVDPTVSLHRCHWRSCTTRTHEASQLSSAPSQVGASRDVSAVTSLECSCCVAGVGELSVWEFSGFEPYFMMYDLFIGDPNCIHVIVFSLQDPPDVQMAQVQKHISFVYT